jgi:hypothetical protein
MSMLRRFSHWVRQDYPGPQGPHIALLALYGTDKVIEVRKDDDGTCWVGVKGTDTGTWVKLS